MEEKNKKFQWKYVGYSFIILACLFVVVYLINLLIITEAPFEVAQSNDWIGFWGGVLGSILSGVITFVVLKITIENENKKREKDMEILENQRLEDKRMSLFPYIKYSIVEDKDLEKINIEKVLDTPFFIDPNLTQEEYKLKYGNVGEVSIDYKFNLVLKNIGLGIIIDPRLVEIHYDGVTTKTMGRNNTVIDVKDNALMKFCVNYPKDYICPMTIKVGYFNLLGDYYEQDVIINFQGVPHFVMDDNKNIVKKDISYNAIVEDVYRPIIIEDFQDTNMRVEVSI